MDERAAAAAGGEGDDCRIGDPVSVQIAEGDRVVDEARVIPFGRTLAIRDRSHAVFKSNWGVVVTEKRQAVFGVAQLFQRQPPRRHALRALELPNQSARCSAAAATPPGPLIQVR